MTGRGIVRAVDELGRIVLPKEFRQSLHIEEKDLVEICMDKDHLEIYPASAVPGACSCCGAVKGLRKHGSVSLCDRCLQKFFDQEAES